MTVSQSARDRLTLLLSSFAGIACAFSALWLWREARLSTPPFGMGPAVWAWCAAGAALVAVCVAAIAAVTMWRVTASVGLTLTALVFGLGPGAPLLGTQGPWNTWYILQAVFPGWRYESGFAHSMAVMSAMGLLGAVGAASWAERVFRAAMKAERKDVTPHRGTSIRSERPGATEAIIREAQKQGRLVCAGVIVPEKSEVRGFLLLGLPGTGKTAALMTLTGTALHRGNRAVTVDPGGELMRRFRQPADVVLNPFMAGSARWDVFRDIRSKSDYAMIAATVVARGSSSQEKQWSEYGRAIVADALEQWHIDRRGPAEDFWKTIALADEATLAALVSGRPSARFFSGDNKRFLGSVLGTMAPSAKAMLMFGEGDGPTFSLRDWVRHGTGNLWLPYSATEIDALRGPLATWTSLVMLEVGDLPESQVNRLLINLDELDAPGQLPTLTDALARLRKKGAIIVMAIQTWAQIEETYGLEARSIVELADNKVILRCGTGPGGGTAGLAADIIGEHEDWRTGENSSTSAGGRGASKGETRQLAITKAVLPSEIADLPDLNGYLRLSGVPGWRRVAFERVEMPLPAKWALYRRNSKLEDGVTLNEAPNQGAPNAADEAALMRERNAKALARFTCDTRDERNIG